MLKQKHYPERSENEVVQSVFNQLQCYWGDLEVVENDGYAIAFTSKSVAGLLLRRYQDDDYLSSIGERLQRFFFEPVFSIGCVAPMPYNAKQDLDGNHLNDVHQLRISVNLEAVKLVNIIDEITNKADAEELQNRLRDAKEQWLKDLWQNIHANCNRGYYLRSLDESMPNSSRSKIPGGAIVSNVLIMSHQDDSAAVFWPALLLEQRVKLLGMQVLLRAMNWCRMNTEPEKWGVMLPRDIGEVPSRVDPISDLGGILEDRVVTRCTPESREQHAQWSNDRLKYYRERFRVKPIPKKYSDLVHDALVQWRDREQHAMKQCLLHALEAGDVGEQAEGLVLGESGGGETVDVGARFDRWFDQARQAFIKPGNEAQIRSVKQAADCIRGGWAVMNIGWVQTLAIFLPQAVEQSRKLEVATHGRRAAALFYIEVVGKVLGEPFTSGGRDSTLADCDAAWELASQSGGIASGLTGDILCVDAYSALCRQRRSARNW